MAETVWWFPISRNNEAKYDVYRRIPMAGTRALYAIDAADKAKAVPFIHIFRVDRTSNAPIGQGISSQFYKPADFGKSLGSAFGERPDISIESVNVKNHMPQGWIQWRDIDINIMIHRPDILNNISDKSKTLGALLTPGQTFVLRYGWVGGRNGILGPGGQEKEDVAPGGEGTANEERQFNEYQQMILARQNIGEQNIGEEPEFYKTIYTARDDVRFSVTHYNFSIMPDNQIKLTVHAKEDGVLNFASANIFEQDELDMMFDRNTLDKKEKASTLLEKVVKHFNEKLMLGSFERTYDIPLDADVLIPGDPSTEVRQESNRFIEMQIVFNILFAQPVAKALNRIGYKHVHLYFGAFQEKMCKTLPSYDGGFDYSGYSIGQFQMKLSDAQKILNQIISTGGQITVSNMLEQFRAYLENPAIFDLNTSLPDVTSLPEIQVFTIFNPDTGYARVQLSDRKRYLTILTPVQMTQQNYHKTKKEFVKNLQENLKTNFIPYFTLFHQSSFFADAKFEIVQDERMRSLFIQARLDPNRTDLVMGKDALKTSTDSGTVSPMVLYRSAVKGTIKMIGNFIFSYAGMVWINFSIPEIDGLFYVMQKVDEIGRDGFTSTYQFQAEGSNPLGTKPRPGETAEDFVKQKLLSCHGASNFEEIAGLPAGSLTTGVENFDYNNILGTEEVNAQGWTAEEQAAIDGSSVNGE